MDIQSLHRWDLTPGEARHIQLEMAEMVTGGPLPQLKTVLGIDVSYQRSTGRFIAAGILLTIPEFKKILSLRHEGKTMFPYIPGLLSFREVPPLLPVLRRMPPPDAIIVDGQGIAHPRGLGLASHIGILTGIPTIGCAKSRLVGEHRDPGYRVGGYEPLTIRERLVGYVVRSKKGCRPIYISPGHLLDPEDALKGTMMCLEGYRLPEPTRLAHKLTRE
ncbi:MAG: endonuclease V [Deltaproteobacteria bacterium]|nr:endonuclease V [Deltaproteobacteria bacterium]